MKKFLYIAITVLLGFSMLAPKAQAYVDVERAEYLHFLVSRWGQLYWSNKMYSFADKSAAFAQTHIRKQSIQNSMGNFRTSQNNSWRYTRELSPHLGWRLGCNIGWEVAGACITLRNHETVDLLTLIQDSISPGLLLYPLGQVMGQAIGGDIAHKLFNRGIEKWLRPYSGKFVLGPKLGATLVEESGVPYVWHGAEPTVQKAASRFLGLAMGTYLAWSLFDLGHNIAYQKYPFIDAFKWSKYKALAMAGFTFGGYIGHNIGFTLAHKKVLPKFFSGKFYANLAGRAQNILEKHDMSRFIGEGTINNPQEFRQILRTATFTRAQKIKISWAAKILNREGMLWRGSQYMAMPVNALFCWILAETLPAGLRKLEKFKTKKDWEFVDSETDPFEEFASLKSDEDKKAFADSMFEEINADYDETILSLKNTLLDLGEDENEVALSEEEKAAINEAVIGLSESKEYMFDISIVLGGALNSILNIAHERIENITDIQALIAFMERDFLPLFGLSDYKTILANRLLESFEKDSDEKIKEIKENLHILIQHGIPEIYLGRLTQGMEDMAANPEFDFNG